MLIQNEQWTISSPFGGIEMDMYKGLCILLLSVVIFFGGNVAHAGGAKISTVSSEFQTPPDDARPHCYWYWMEGNISKEGLNADLEAMKRVGIGGVGIYTITGHSLTGKINTFGPEWHDLFKYAIKRAGELGIEVTINNSPRGWSSTNGPWVTPEMSMKVLSWSETQVKGGAPFSGELKRPETAKRVPIVKDFYKDIIVLAYPTPEAEKTLYPKPKASGYGKDFNGDLLFDDKANTGCSMPIPQAGGEKQYLELVYNQPIKAGSLTLIPLPNKQIRGGKLMTSDDQTKWRLVTQFGAVAGGESTFAFPVATSRFWRMEFDGQKVTAIGEVKFGLNYRISDFIGKAQYKLEGTDRPKFTPVSFEVPVESRISKDSIINISSKMDDKGHLNWTPPSGDWTILRFGYINNDIEKYGYIYENGVKKQVYWLETDKFSKAATDLHWNNYEKILFEDKSLDSIIKNVHIDSYEGGAQNWTDNFPDEFQKRTGYDLMAYFPIMAGRVVDSVHASERVLWDFRQVCNDLITNNYFGYFQELCRKSGKKFSLEGYNQNQFHCGTVSSKGDIPMCEFWANPDVRLKQKLSPKMPLDVYWANPGPGHPVWFKSGASPAHIYGRPIVGAEAFTSNIVNGGDYTTDPWCLKVLGDSAFCGGVNRYVYHVFTHQPWLNQAPGATLASYGTHFERTNTWFEQMKGFNAYVTRCQNLLQKGQFIADVLYSHTENTPNHVGRFKIGTNDAPFDGPRGFDFDLCSPDEIINRITLQDGKFIMPGGMVYRLLVMPEDADVMSPALIKKIGELVKNGATVISPKPLRSPSMINQPTADVEISKIAEEVWADCDGVKSKEHVYGKGRVIWGKDVQNVLASLKVVEDFNAGNTSKPINYIHRRFDDGELYFVANTASEMQSADCKFRVAGMKPELWDPVTGEMRVMPEFREENGRTVIPLKFESRQSYFIIFKKESVAPSGKTPLKNFPLVTPELTLEGAWAVKFDPKWGGPAQSVTFSKLEDWSKRSEDGIKYYSGKATYSKTFDHNAISSSGSRVFLDLGAVKNLAEVRLNGKDLGVVWCAPWRVEVTGLLKAKDNDVQIDVVNLWVNRIIGDEQLPEDCEYKGTFREGHGWLLSSLPAWFINNKPRESGRYFFGFSKNWLKSDPLLPSGLLGPVRLMKME